MVGYGGAIVLRLFSTNTGMTLECEELMLRAFFLHSEPVTLEQVLEAAHVEIVMVHQLLGLSAETIRMLKEYVKDRRSICYLHDFFAICPRVTMLDAVGQFCDVGSEERCGRCVRFGGVHEASRLNELEPAEHRALMRDFLASVERVVAPSANTAAYFARIMPEIRVQVLPHLDLGGPYPESVREGAASYDDIVLLGAIGPHKGSVRLLELARLARISHPELRFHVVGYTDIDKALKAVGNVNITGAYKAPELEGLVRRTGARIALFLHEWPETFSYTLTEAVRLGLFPMVPDVGAPAERVRAAGFGAVFDFPVDPGRVLEQLAKLKTERVIEITSYSPAAFTDLRGPLDIAQALGLQGAIASSPVSTVPAE